MAGNGDCVVMLLCVMESSGGDGDGGGEDIGIHKWTQCLW